MSLIIHWFLIFGWNRKIEPCSDFLHQNKHSFREEYVQKTLSILVSTQLLQQSNRQNVKLKLEHAILITELTTSVWSVRIGLDLRVYHSWSNIIQLFKISYWALVSNLWASARVTPAELMNLLMSICLHFFRRSCPGKYYSPTVVLYQSPVPLSCC